MSRLNISGVVKKIRSVSNPYLPILEAIVNSIDAIAESKRKDGRIDVFIKRENCMKIDTSFIPSVQSIEIVDNGIGFTSENRESFDTFYSDMKLTTGGKGFGRFMYLKYFDSVRVESVYKEGKQFHRRTFDFGKQYDIIINEQDEICDAKDYETHLYLNDISDSKYLDKGLDIIAKRLLENLLVFFTDENAICPIITVHGEEEENSIVLNNLMNGSNQIQKTASQDFSICDNNSEKRSFKAVIFKVYHAGNQKSRIILTAHNREVTSVSLSQYIPEFEDEFYDTQNNDKDNIFGNYIVVVYVLGDYLNENVSLERDAFEIDKTKGLGFSALSQCEIEQETAQIVKTQFDDEVSVRVNKKIEKLNQYVNDVAPWHREYARNIDISTIPYHLTEEIIELALQKEKFKADQNTRIAVKAVLADDANLDDGISGLIQRIAQSSKDDLAHYVCTRKAVLSLFEKLLKRKADGKSELEKEIHNLIFPMGGTSDTISYNNHNLWLLDERLVFSEFIASDRKIGKMNSPKEPDLVVFDKKRSFRNGDNEFSNPLTVFEFKRPKRTDYSDSEDPISQIGQYVDEIRAGKYETPDGMEKVKVNDCTPVYGYLICDPCARIDYFAGKVHSLTKSPDEEGFFGFLPGFKMYVEVISFKRLLNNAELRNKIFFNKLNID